uniref:Uncharacterized protein n=1 Tax=Rhizophora mucronata TaxID=61149 RepID=A0A2P2NVA9_RHIMU
MADNGDRPVGFIHSREFAMP